MYKFNFNYKTPHIIMKFNNIHWDDIEIDRRILPLFRSNIQIKKKELLKKNNYDLNLIRPKKLQLINEVIPLNVKLVKTYNLINNYSLIINNLYLKNDVLKALPFEDKLNIKMYLDNIVLKLKLFEPIFSFNSLNYLDYFYKVLGNKKNKLTKAQKKKVKERKKAIRLYNNLYTNMRKDFFNPILKDLMFFPEKENLKNILDNNQVIKSNANNVIVKKKRKKNLISNLNVIKFLDKNYFKHKSKLNLNKLKLSILFLQNNQKNKNWFNFIKSVLTNKKKFNKKNIKKIKEIITILQKKNKKYSALKKKIIKIKKKNVISFNVNKIYTNNKFKNFIFGDIFSKKRLGPKPSKINNVWYSKLYTHSLKTPIDVSNFFYHRKIENNIAKKNIKYRFWFNHTLNDKNNQKKYINKFINLRNTFTKSSYNTISKPLNYKIKNTLLKLNSSYIFNNFKNKNMINKFYKLKILNNNKKYFLWNFLYKNSIMSKKYNINNNKNSNFIKPVMNKNNKINNNVSLINNFKNNKLDFHHKWNNLNLMTRLIILWELKKNSHFIQLFNYFNKKKVNKDICNNFNNFFYEYLYINDNKNKFFENIKLNKINKKYSKLFFKPDLKINNVQFKSNDLITNNNKINNIKAFKSNKNMFYMFYSYPLLNKIFIIEAIKHKYTYNKFRQYYLQLRRFIHLNLKNLKKEKNKFILKHEKNLILIKKDNLLNKKKNKNTKWISNAYNRRWIKKYKRFKNKKLIKSINNILTNNLIRKVVDNSYFPNEYIKKINVNIKINNSIYNNTFLDNDFKNNNNYNNKEIILTFDNYFAMLRKSLKTNSQITSRHIFKIKPRIIFNKSISRKYALFCFKSLKFNKNNFINIYLNKRINFKIKNLKFKILSNKNNKFNSKNNLNKNQNNNYYNFDKHIKNVVKGAFKNPKKIDNFNKFINPSKYLGGYKYKSNNKFLNIKNDKINMYNNNENNNIYNNINNNKNNNLIKPFQAKNFVNLIKNKNNKLIIKEMLKILNNVDNEINIIYLKKREKSIKIKIDKLINKVKNKIFILTIIDLFKKINFFKFTKKDKLIYPANTLFILYFKKEFELMLSNFFKAGVFIPEFNLPNKVYMDIASKYNLYSSLPIFYINNLSLNNILMFKDNINKNNLINNFILPHPAIVSVGKNHKIFNLLKTLNKKNNINSVLNYNNYIVGDNKNIKKKIKKDSYKIKYNIFKILRKFNKNRFFNFNYSINNLLKNRKQYILRKKKEIHFYHSKNNLNFKYTPLLKPSNLAYLLNNYKGSNNKYLSSNSNIKKLLCKYKYLDINKLLVKNINIFNLIKSSTLNNKDQIFMKIYKLQKLEKIIFKVNNKLNINKQKTILSENIGFKYKYIFKFRKKKKFRRKKIQNKIILNRKINKFINKKIYIKYLNNYKFVIMKRKKNKEQLFRKLYALKKIIKLNKLIKLKKIIIPFNFNKNKFNKISVLRKYPTPIKGRKEEKILSINSAKENKINMVKWIKWRIIKIKKFDWEVSTVFNYSPVDMLYFNKNNKNYKNYNNNIKEQPIIHYYLKSMSIFNRIFKGSFVFFNKFVGFNFNHANNNYNNKLRDNIFKFLFFSFKKMFSLISKPIFVFTPDKVVINLFYYILLPSLLKKKINFKNTKIKKMKKLKKKIFKYKTYDKYFDLNKSNNTLQKFNQTTNINNKNYKNNIIYLPNNYIPEKYKSLFKDYIIFPHSYKSSKIKMLLKFRIKKKINSFKKLHKINRIKLKLLAEISLIKMYPKIFENLCRILSKFLKKKIELNLIRLHYPYKDSHILANYLRLVVNKLKFVLLTRKIFRHAIIKKLSKLFIRNKYNIIPSFLTGLKIKIAGRLMKYKVIPRKTIKLAQRGSSSIGTVNFTSFSRVTAKNRRGAYSITVSSGQNFF